MEVDLFAQAAMYGRYLHRRFYMVDAQDISQEILIWVFTHDAKVEEYQDGTERGKGKLLKSMYHAGLKFCQEEKARVLGYKVEDNYYYELGLIRDTLTRIWDEEAWTNPPQPVEQAKVKHRSVSEGNNYVATLADVSRAVSQLPRADQLILRWFFNDGYTADEISKHLDITKAACESRIHRLVKRIQRALGGERPQSGD